MRAMRARKNSDASEACNIYLNTFIKNTIVRLFIKSIKKVPTMGMSIKAVGQNGLFNVTD